ncbi:gasdermin-A3-like [Oenanthe melanoleuca]|uniref:gasdermin-A3-like n=1 Tax=Oenanthe melanoleuca TaxID=2939378 RepID=UPI0024C156D4|nr:gasdermin-A3-like [Oenanthe melanoleuca]
MFKKFTKVIAKEMDPRKDLVPVESIADNEHFRPLYLLKKKRKSKTIFHPYPYYQPTGLKLDDVLLPGQDDKSIESPLQVSRQIIITKTITDQGDGGLRIAFDPASADLQGGASLSKAIVIKAHKKSISLQSLEALKKERKINMDHSFIQQLLRTDIDLHLVTEILEASEQTVYKESTKADGGFKATFYATFSAKGNRESNQDIVIPEGCTLAFKTILLVIRNGAWNIAHFPRGHCLLQIDQPQAKDVVSEVECRYQIFSKLSPDILFIVFNTIKVVMSDKNLLQELRQKMEDIPKQNDGYELKTESPDLKDLFSTLQHSPRDRLHQLTGGITYILDALHELMDEQLWLLLQSLERKILTQQLKLVENLLDQDLAYTRSPFHVDARLLSFPHKEEQMLTMELVELSGVQLQEDGSAVPRDKPFESVAALFAALYALNLLSGSKQDTLGPAQGNPL